MSTGAIINFLRHNPELLAWSVDRIKQLERTGSLVKLPANSHVEQAVKDIFEAICKSIINGDRS